MPVTERVMAMGDWSIRLRADTPIDLRRSISTPFALVYVTPARLPATGLTDDIVEAAAMWAGVVFRPGPQFELGGVGLEWFLGDGQGGTGWLLSGWNVAAGTLSDAVTKILSDNTSVVPVGCIAKGTVGTGTVAAWDTGPTTRRDALETLTRQFSYEWRVNPDRTLDVNSVANLYGASPLAIIERRAGPEEVAAPYGVTGSVSSTWDFEDYGSQTFVWSTSGWGYAGGTSPYYDPDGVALTVVRNYEITDAPSGTQSTIASWWLSQINRAVRTVEVTAEKYSVTNTVPVGSSVWLYDPEQNLYDVANQVQHAGRTITPVSARLMAATWPIERGQGVYYRVHDGTSVTYVDLTDWVEWEQPGSRWEVSTASQVLTPPPAGTSIQALYSPWQPYDAVFAQTLAAPTIGNAEINVRFRRLGTSVDIAGKVKFGLTTVLGAGQFGVTMPPNCIARTAAGRQTGTFHAIDVDVTNTNYSGICWVDPTVSSGATIYFGTSNPVDPVRHTYNAPPLPNDWSPFLWGQLDEFTFNLTCEVEW
jgi:hypothetical protein